MVFSHNATGLPRYTWRLGEQRGTQVWMRLHEPLFLGCIEARFADQVPWQVDLPYIVQERPHPETDQHRLIKVLHRPEHEGKDAHIDDMCMEMGFKLAHVHQSRERFGLAQHRLHEVSDDLLCRSAMERSTGLCPLKKALDCCDGFGVDRTRQSQIRQRRDKRSTTGGWMEVVLLPLPASLDIFRLWQRLD